MLYVCRLASLHASNSLCSLLLKAQETVTSSSDLTVVESFSRSMLVVNSQRRSPSWVLFPLSCSATYVHGATAENWLLLCAFVLIPCFPPHSYLFFQRERGCGMWGKRLNQECSFCLLRTGKWKMFSPNFSIFVQFYGVFLNGLWLRTFFSLHVVL